MASSTLIILILSLHWTLGAASTIKGPPTAPQRHLHQLARLGDEVKLQCPMEGNSHLLLIEWYKGDEAIDTTWTRYRTNKKSLKIKDVDKSDSGKFLCKGINGFGKEKIEIDLIVIDPEDFPGLEEGELPDVAPPHWSQDMQSVQENYQRRQEDTLKISCSAGGKPEPEIVWYKNGHEMLENTRKRPGRNVLLIRNLMQRDAGVFTCVARNVVGELRRDFSLSMEEDLTDLSGPMNRTVREGDTATFDCQVSSSDKPHIKWLKKLEPGDRHYYNSSQVIPVGDDIYKLIHTSSVQEQGEKQYLSQLSIPAVTPHKSGMYICFVTNSRGTFTYKRAFLTVIPKFESLTGESSFVLILVISLSVVVVLMLVGIIICVVRRRRKESPSSVQEPGEVRHQLMPAQTRDQCSAGVKSDQPLPPPPTPTQWSHLYTGHTTYTDNSSQYCPGNTYEVPHLPPASSTPRYGGYYPAHPPSLASSHSGVHSGVQYSSGPTHMHYYPDRQIL